MTIAPCPRCDDPVSLPDHASTQATVRCPLCQETFAITDILVSLPPALIVVEDPEATDESTSPESLFFADSATDRPVNLLDEVESDARPAAIAIEPMGSSAEPSATPSSGGRRRAAPRPQRKKKSPAMEVVKVFLGGVAGLVIAQAILWWLPWTKYRRDPFDLGPKVSSFAGWMVPAQFHDKGNKPVEAGEAEPTSKNTESSPPSTDGNEFGPSAGELPQRTFVDPNEVQEDTQPSQAAAGEGRDQGNGGKKQNGGAEQPADGSVADVGEPVAMEDAADDTQVTGISIDPLGDMNLDADLLNMIEPSDDPILEEPTADEPVLEDPTLEEPTLEEPGMSGLGGTPPAIDPISPALQIANAPQVSEAELREAVDQANTVIQAWASAEDPSDQRLIAQSYQTLANLAEAVTFTDAMSIEQTQTVADLLSSLTSEPKRLRGLKMVGPRWAAFAGREGTGIVLVGEVIDSQQEGDVYVTKLEVAEGKEPMTIYRDTDPAADCPPGQSIVVLGAIVDDPEDRVPGYAGDAATLIWTGQCLILN